MYSRDLTNLRHLIARNSKKISLAITLWVNLMVTYVVISSIDVFLAKDELSSLAVLYTADNLFSNPFSIISAVLIPVGLAIANIFITCDTCEEILWDATVWNIDISNTLKLVAKCAFCSLFLCTTLYLLLYVITLLNIAILIK